MSGINKVILLGRLTRDPELKDVKGLQIANFSIATSKQWKDADGTKQEKAEFHNCVAFKKTAELVGKYLSKGRQVYVEGELQTSSWDDKDSGKKRYKTEIVVQTIQFLGDSSKAETSQELAPSTPAIDNNEEIPF